MTYIDIHTHNHDTQRGVIKVINVFPWEHANVDDDSENIFTSGIHPWYINEIDVGESFRQIETRIKMGIIKGIGEAGLDGIRGPEQKVQEETFKEHIRISEVYKCPLIIHCVKKYNEILAIKKTTKAKQPWILHSFNSSLQMMEQMIDAGIFISLGSALLKGSERVAEVCRQVPSEYLFLETDDSKFMIEDIYQKAADHRGQTVEELKERLYKNFKEVF